MQKITGFLAAALAMASSPMVAATSHPDKVWGYPPSAKRDNGNKKRVPKAAKRAARRTAQRSRKVNRGK